MSLLLLGLLGSLVLGAFAFDGSDDNDNDQADDDNPMETGESLSYSGANLLEGTEGADTLSAGQDELLAPNTINLLGGDDTAIIEVNDAITVSGGDGDDVITATGVINVLEGGAGNDTLTADDSNQIRGGAGDDELNFNHGSYDQGERGSVNGGEGDDTINLRADALIAGELLNDVGGGDITGGAGSDEFNILYELTSLGEGEALADDTVSRGFVSISDFDPREDSLLLDVERNTDTADIDVVAELDQTVEAGTYTSLITLTFEAADEAAEATNILTVISAVPFTLDDIQLVGV